MTRSAPAPAPRPTPSIWMPLTTCRVDCVDVPVPLVDTDTRRRRVVRFAAAAGLGAARGLPVPASSRRRRRAMVCSAAQILSALGVRVEVHAPAVAWPRGGAGRLVVSNHISWLDDLALLTAVPGIPVAKVEIATWPVVGRLLSRADGVFLDRARLRALPGVVADVAERLRRGGTVLAHPEGTTSCGAQLDRFRPALFQAAVDAAAPICPVAIRYRVDADTATAVTGYVSGDSLRRSIRRIVATRNLVVEVHLLAALDPARADRRTLAALAEYAVAEVVEARPPAGVHPRVPRRPAAPTPLRSDQDRLPDAV